MKKTYVKPDIVLECFQFSANIALDCKNPEDASGKTYYENGFPVLLKPASNGDFTCTIDEGGLCLQVPMEDSKVWQS